MAFKRIRKKLNHILIIFTLIIIITISLLIGLFVILGIKNPFIFPDRIIRHPHDIFSPHKVFIEAHCGINREIFQNTLESFSKAIEYNIESLETDVWLTKDNVLVLIHGNSKGDIDDYLDHRGNVPKLTWEELSSYKTKKDGLSVPKLRDAMKLTKNKIFIDLEIKDPRVDLVFPKVMELIEEFDFFDQISLCSFHYKYYDKIKEYNEKNNKKIIFGFGYYPDRKNYDFSKKGNTLNIYWNYITKEICDKAHENGMAVVAWFRLKENDDVENIENYKKIIDNGVDIIISNYPVAAKKYRDSLYKKSFFSKININLFQNLKKSINKLFFYQY